MESTAATFDLRFPLQLRGNATGLLTLQPMRTMGTLRANGDRVDFEIPAGKHLYVRTGEGANFDDPPGEPPAPLFADTVYALRGEIETTGEPTRLIIVEYDREGNRLGHKMRALSDGPLHFEWHTHAELASWRIGLRLAGAGSIQIRDLALIPQAELHRPSASELQAARRALADLGPAHCYEFARIFFGDTGIAPDRAIEDASRDHFHIDPPQASTPDADAPQDSVPDGETLAPPADWQSQRTDDPHYLWKLNAWFFMEPVLRAPENAAARENRERAVRSCWRVAVDWLEQHPRGRKDVCPYVYDVITTTARLTYLTTLLRDPIVLANLEDEALALALQWIRGTTEWYEQDANYHRRHNHGLFHDVLLLIGATRLPFLARATQSKHARTRFADTLADTFAIDEGLHLEHSSQYQVHMIELLTLLARENLLPELKLDELAERMKSAGGWLVDLDGNLLQLGDTHRMPAPDYLREPARAARGLRAFPRGGFAAVRGDDHALAFQAAFHSRGHKHADDLSFVLSARGRRLIVDPGCFGYYYDDPGRQFATSTRAHNVLTLEGDESPWKSQEPYGSGLLATGETAGWFALVGENPLLGAHGARHTRVLLYRPNELLLIIDRIEPTEPDAELPFIRRYLQLDQHVAGLYDDDGVVRGRWADGLPLRIEMLFAPLPPTDDQEPEASDDPDREPIDGEEETAKPATPVRDAFDEHEDDEGEPAADDPRAGVSVMVCHALGPPIVQGFVFPARRTWEPAHTVCFSTNEPGVSVIAIALSGDQPAPFENCEQATFERDEHGLRVELATPDGKTLQCIADLATRACSISVAQ